MSDLQRGITLGLALVLDLLAGDPPNRFHPVAWMGSLIAAGQRRAPREGRAVQLAYGAALDVCGAGAAAGAGFLIERLCARLPKPLGWLIAAGVLKTSLALRGLTHAGGEVATALENGRLDEARRLTSWHLVSRDTGCLESGQVAAAVVESVAENSSDGVIAPLFFYALFGLPGALAYRFMNTADSMLGYRDPAREWLGKIPARLDDLANLIPARLSAGLILLAAALRGDDLKRAVSVWRRDARQTASPNAGHPMSAMAGALGVQLEKVDHYRLGAGLPAPQARDVRRAVGTMRAAVGLGALLLGGALLLNGLKRRSE